MSLLRPALAFDLALTLEPVLALELALELPLPLALLPAFVYELACDILLSIF